MALTAADLEAALVAAMSRANPDLRADRLVLADGAAPWTLTDRAYRLELQGFVPQEWYRGRPGTVLRVDEGAILHIQHAVGGDQSRTRRIARADAQRVLLGLLDDTTLRAAGVLCTVVGIAFSVLSSGDTLATTITLELGYDLTIESGVAVAT